MGAAAEGPVRLAAVCSGGLSPRDRRGGTTFLRPKTWLSVSAAGLVSLACRPPTLIDPLGRPVFRPLLVASVDYGRLVIDSSSDGIRAIVELTRMLPDSTYERAGTVPLLRCSARGTLLAPVRASSEPMTCNPRPTAAGCTRAGQTNVPCDYPNNRIVRACSQVLHLEYRLDAAPSVGDSVTVQLVDRVSRSRWTHP